MKPPVWRCRCPRPHQVPGPRAGPLHGAEHDGDVRPQPDAVGGPVGLEPLLGVDLVGTEHGADLVVEDLRRGAGQRRQPRLFQSPQVVDEGLAQAPRPLGHLQRGEPVDVDPLRRLSDGPDHLEVVVAVEARVDAALEAHLGGPGGLGLGDSLGDVAQLQEVRGAAQVERQRALGERAEPALEGAHVGVVDVAVGHPGDHVADLVAAQLVGDLGHGPHLGAPGREQRDDLVLADLLAEAHPGEHLRHGAIARSAPRPDGPARRPGAVADTGPAPTRGGGAATPPEHHGSSRPRPSASRRSRTGNRMAGSIQRSGSRAYSG